MNNYFFSCFVSENICNITCYDEKRKKFKGKGYGVDYDLMRNVISVINEVNLGPNIKCNLTCGCEFYYKIYGNDDNEEINIYINCGNINRIVNLSVY
jgi:hypothetical protein